jgi:DNA damage-inducible protein 1
MSKRKAQECGVLHLVDERFAGVAVGVGTGKILGRIHLVSLQIGSSYFPCTVTVMDEAGLGDKNMDFLLGLDMLKVSRVVMDGWVARVYAWKIMHRALLQYPGTALY